MRRENTHGLVAFFALIDKRGCSLRPQQVVTSYHLQQSDKRRRPHYID